MSKKWEPEEEAELREALAEVRGGTLQERCRELDGWHGRSWESIRHKANKLNIPDEISFTDSSLTTVENQVLDVIRKKKITSVGEISREVDRSKETVKETLAVLYEKGYEVEYEDDTRQVKIEPHEHKQLDPLDLSILKGETLKFGLIGDVHFGSKFQSLSLVRTAHEIFTREKCYFVINTGDIVDGIDMYKGHESELFLHGADEQLDYTIENYPNGGLKTYLVSGNHDLSFKKKAGLNICRRIAEARKDIVYRGDCAADFVFHEKYRFNVIHPDGGVAYAKSYKPQKIVEALINEAISEARNYFSEASIDRIPIASGIGHYHIAGWFPIAGVNAVMGATLQKQTDYMKRKALSPDIGFFVITLDFDKKGKNFSVIPKYYRMADYVRDRDW